MYINELYKYLPINNKIDWELIQNEILSPFYLKMQNTNQDLRWHKEGNVYNHTKLVCEQLISLKDYQELSKKEQLEVFLACLFHDIGKIVCTKTIDNEITSPNHAIIGSEMIREYLWKDLELSGTKEYQNFRETICFLVKYHSNPVHIGMDEEERNVIKLSINQELASDFNLKLLLIVAKADVLGRICIDLDYQLEYLAKFEEICKNLDCFTKPFTFKNTITKYKYLSGKNIYYLDELYDDSKLEVTMICGLPGTGKDTFIKNNYNLPVVSLDDIRFEYKLTQNDDQGKVFNIAKEQMKVYLRKQENFIFNATNLIQLNRKKIIKLFVDYNAKVKIIFLETTWNENISRNKNRKKQINPKIIEKMLTSLNTPENYESHIVEWICI